MRKENKYEKLNNIYIDKTKRKFIKKFEKYVASFGSSGSFNVGS